MTTQTQITQRQRNEITSADEANLQAIAAAYAVMWDRLQGDTNALMLAIEQLDSPTQVQIKKLPEYKALIKRMETELDRFTVFLETVLGTAALAAIGLGLAHSEELINAVIGGGFAGIESGVISVLLDYLKEGSPLYNRLELLTGATVDSVIEAIINGVGSGYNPQKIAALIQDAFGGGLTDALRNMRTLQLYAYRDSAIANYIASGVVDKWMWWAELDDLVCMSCVAEHGTLHDLSESLDAHYNCRCAAVPYIEGLSEEQQTGADWFDSLSPEQQSAMMGSEYYSAYKDGMFNLEDMIKSTENEVYGNMNTVTPLWELLGAEPP